MKYIYHWYGFWQTEPGVLNHADGTFDRPSRISTKKDYEQVRDYISSNLKLGSHKLNIVSITLLSSTEDELKDPKEAWLPIDTAPKDGSWILAAVSGTYDNTGKSYAPSVVAWNETTGTWVQNEDEDEDVDCHWGLNVWQPLPPSHVGTPYINMKN